MGKKSEKPNPTIQAVKEVLREHAVLTILLVLFIVLVIVGTLIPPQILRIIIDTKLTKGMTEGIFLLAALYVGVTILTNLCDFLKSAFLTAIGEDLVARLRNLMAEKMRRLPLSYYTHHTPGAVTSHCTADAEQVNKLFSGGLVNLVIDMFKIVGIFISIALFSVPMALIAFVFMVAMYFITIHFRGALFAAQKTNLKEISRVNSHISETLGAMHTIKAYARERYMEKRYSERLMDNYRTLDRVNFYDSIFPTFIQLLKFGLIAVIVVLSAPELGVTGITVGALAASIDLVSHLFRPIDQFGQELEKIQEGKSGIAGINEFLCEKEEEPKNDKLTLTDIIPEAKASITFDNVSYRYPDGDKMILDGIDLSIPAGSSTALVGRTGVGKTTTFRLILGLLKPTGGRILVNGIPTDTIPSRLRRRVFGYVEQEFSPVSGGLYDQIRVYDSTIGDDKCRWALDFVGLGYLDPAHFSPEDLSQGQKQLLSIARAVAADPPILLFDEITAALDARTEKKLTEILAKASAGRTVFSISHRESTMRAAARLVVMKDGKIERQGTPDEILGTPNS